MKVIVDAQQRFDCSVGMQDVVLEAFSAQMHVGEETEQRGVVRQSTGDLHAIIIGARRNHEGMVRELQSQHTLLWRLLRKYHSNAGLVPGRMAVGRVMHLEDEV